MKKLGIIHTTPVTIDALKKLVSGMIPECETINILDDTILPQLINGGTLEDITPRWEQYAKVLESRGADVILSACSSVGEVVDVVQPKVDVPVMRIDEAMGEHAISNATKIGVAATLETTMGPTINLLRKKAEEIGKTVEFTQQVASSAYEKLVQGDKEGHDQDVAAVLKQLASKTEFVVLAQASMARVVATFPTEEQSRFLTSPKLGIAAVKEKFEELASK
ncbi:aspartate/glutamate racemase family protein [Evansella tamaricis]|uniref:Aspartate/glutamate racemase family protein n=1 Tax=Evansella tamaricis TaxID=2069301 RepID=A0ABS6JDA7_9BACI|nr:aspartate/glutamate racemase family protein [Evansella tamaricis]MBU9711662.1 aspartate/glutamate racemase family protein [Evansella tamaricis]